MLTINDNTITITRGDTLETTVDIWVKTGSQPKQKYIPSEGDVIRFALKSSYRDEEPLIYKIIPSDTLILRLEAEDTKKLEARRKPYVYDVQITTATGYVSTFIDCAKLYVTEEVE